MCKTESLHCVAEIDTTLWHNCTSIKNKLGNTTTHSGNSEKGEEIWDYKERLRDSIWSALGNELDLDSTF